MQISKDSPELVQLYAWRAARTTWSPAGPRILDAQRMFLAVPADDVELLQERLVLAGWQVARGSKGGCDWWDADQVELQLAGQQGELRLEPSA